MTLNVIFIGHGDLVAAWKHVFSTFHLILREKQFLTFVTFNMTFIGQGDLVHVFLDVSSHFGKKVFDLLCDLEYDLYRSRLYCTTCFLIISSHFRKIMFLTFVTLNMTFLTDLERSRVKNVIALHIYTITSSYAIRINSLQ